MLRLSSSLLVMIALLTACAATPDGGNEGEAATYSGNPDIQFRLLAAEDGPFANLNAGEFPPGHTVEYQWLELAREDAGRSVLVKEQDGKKLVPVQMMDDYELTGADIVDVQASTAQDGGMAVSITLDQEAAQRMRELTLRHKEPAAGGEDPRLLAFVVGGRVHGAYSIRDTITDGSIQLSGRFTSAERDKLIRLLRGDHDSTKD
jgi:preprotein translocase subunit SecD